MLSNIEGPSPATMIAFLTLNTALRLIHALLHRTEIHPRNPFHLCSLRELRLIDSCHFADSMANHPYRVSLKIPCRLRAGRPFAPQMRVTQPQPTPCFTRSERFEFRARETFSTSCLPCQAVIWTVDCRGTRWVRR